MFFVGLPSFQHTFAIVTKSRVWVLRAENEEQLKEWMCALDPSRMVEDSLMQVRHEYDLLRGEMEKKDEIIADLSAALDREQELVFQISSIVNILFVVYFKKN
jgi:hypothetical protein